MIFKNRISIENDDVRLSYWFSTFEKLHSNTTSLVFNLSADEIVISYFEQFIHMVENRIVKSTGQVRF